MRRVRTIEDFMLIGKKEIFVLNKFIKMNMSATLYQTRANQRAEWGDKTKVITTFSALIYESRTVQSGTGISSRRVVRMLVHIRMFRT